MSIQLDQIGEIVDQLFCSGSGPETGYVQREREEVLEDVLFRFRLSKNKQQYSLQVFRGLDRVGGWLWEQQVRVLMRFSQRNSEALPRVIKGSYHEEAEIASIITASSLHDLSRGPYRDRLRGDPQSAVKHVKVLADALARLHGHGLMHRNLWPGAIEVLPTVDEETRGEESLAMRLQHFEMSTFVASVLRPATVGSAEKAETRRAYYRKHYAKAGGYYPPERLAFLFDQKGVDQFETDRSDVFGLGMIAWELFCGALPEGLLARDRYDPEAFEDDLGFLRDAISRTSLPVQLADLIREMIRTDARFRPSAGEVADRLVRSYEAIVSFFGPGEDRRPPFQLGFFPKSSVQTAYEKFGWVVNNPLGRIGQEELRDFVTGDLVGAEIAFSSEGFSPFARGQAGQSRYAPLARWVLLGQQGAYFASPFDHNESPQALDWKLMTIRFMVPARSVASLRHSSLLRRLPRYEVSAVDAAQVDPRDFLDAPSWWALCDSVAQGAAGSRWKQTLRAAYQFLLDYQSIELDARIYAYRLEEPGRAGEALLSFDDHRDSARLARSRHSALMSLYRSSEARRPPFGYFFDGLESDEPKIRLLIHPHDCLHRRESSVVVTLEERVSEHRIRVRAQRGAIPELGWIRPHEDDGQRAILKRQREALFEFLQIGTLTDQLNFPTPSQTVRYRSKASTQLKGRVAGEALEKFLTAEPLYALHGPPGTGKTLISALAVEESLRQDQSMRLLVSAQSNYALDNLATRIMARFQEDAKDQQPLALRMVSKREPDPHVKELVEDAQVDALVRRIQARCRERLRSGDDPPKLRALVETWLSKTEACRPELATRVRRGANIVFATCGKADRSTVGDFAGFGDFDWVILEEAAKAWPTELAIPLVRGRRWTLIGDHLQLPAYRRREVSAFLAECQLDKDDEVASHGRRREEYEEAFDLFRHIFQLRDGERSDGTSRLDRQFRMAPAIAEVVSRAFYQQGGGLETDPSTNRDHGFRQPSALSGRSLVWIDTEDELDCEEEPFWFNRGEVKIIARLLHALRPFPTATPGRPLQEELAILSPYRKQNDLLAASGLPAAARSLIQTVDAFQGREANCVIVSLVRSKFHQGAAHRSLGHLAHPGRTNVLFSRARRLLILVGRFQHFERAARDPEAPGGFWSEICQVVRERGVILSPRQVFR